jgi:hypothetical protein
MKPNRQSYGSDYKLEAFGVLMDKWINGVSSLLRLLRDKFVKLFHTPVDDIRSEWLYRKERFKQRMGEMIWACIGWILTPVVLLAWLLRPSYRFLRRIWMTVWGRISWVFAPVLRFFAPVFRLISAINGLIGKVILKHSEWLDKRGLVGVAVVVYVYLFICVIGFFTFDPNSERIGIRTNDEMVEVRIDANRRPPSRSSSLNSASLPKRRPASLPMPLSSASLPRRTSNRSARSRGMWGSLVNFPNLGTILRRSIESQKIERIIEAKRKEDSAYAKVLKPSSTQEAPVK